MTKTRRFLYSLLFYALAGLGISLTIKANIGVSSFNSMNVATSNAAQIKVGSITIVINLLFLIGYMFITRFSQPKKYILQGISLLCLGFVINIFTHSVFQNFLLENYILRLVVFVLGTTIAGFATGMVINFDMITFPIESLCLALSERTNASFVQLRYLVDICSVMISIGISVVFQLSFFVREGTILSLFLLSAVIGVTKKRYSDLCSHQPLSS